VFDLLYLVVGKRHMEKASRIVPEWWGVKVAVEHNGSIELQHHQDAQPNPHLDRYLIAELLSKVEAIGVLETFGLADGWRTKKIRLIHERLAKELPLDELREQVRTVLKERPGRIKAYPIALA
jgi:hypothetical protein